MDWIKAIQTSIEYIEGVYGICFDEEMAGNRFRYMIADNFRPEAAAENNLEVYDIPGHTWAVFPCLGSMPLALQEVNKKIFSWWLPASLYELSEGYNIEYYSNAADYNEGIRDPAYYAEVWIPVKKK